MRIKTKLLDNNLRIESFLEVDLGYDYNDAILEAKRCLACKNAPCQKGCPVNVPIKDFINHLKNNEVDSALAEINKNNILPGICGRVCPQEQQCESYCVMGNKDKSNAINIGKLERFASDKGKKVKIKSLAYNGIKIAIIGSGPAGMACAFLLARNGFDVTVFEALHEAGGVLVYGIPEFRLPKALVKKEWEQLLELGVKLERNTIIGKTILISELEEKGFKEFFVATGAGFPNSLNINGENLEGVYYANGFLTRINLMKAHLFPKYHTPFKYYEKVAVIGGGNVALDAARTAKRLKAKEVYIIYRRGQEELPARLEEIRHAEEEGIIFIFLASPKEIIGKEKVEGLLYEKMVLGESGKDGRREFISTGEYVEIKIDMVIIAVGQKANPSFFNNILIDRNKFGNIIINEDGLTSKANIYAGGDIASGASTVIKAMGAGQKAAEAIIKKYQK